MHAIDIRVWYEDTDMGGVVYHANYLKYCERGRSDALRAHGVDQNAMREAGIVFVVRDMRCDWRRPARLDDILRVETRLAELKGASAGLLQRVMRNAETLFEAEVRVACMDAAGRPCRIPAPAVQALQALGGPGTTR